MGDSFSFSNYFLPLFLRPFTGICIIVRSTNISYEAGRSSTATEASPPYSFRAPYRHNKLHLRARPTLGACTSIACKQRSRRPTTFIWVNLPSIGSRLLRRHVLVLSHATFSSFGGITSPVRRTLTRSVVWSDLLLTLELPGGTAAIARDA